MVEKRREKFQIDSTEEIRLRAKAVALQRGFKSLNDFVHDSLMKAGDPKLTQLIQAYLDERPKRGRSSSVK